MGAIRSMTGFARHRYLSQWGEMTFTLKSVNHRSLDVHLHLPPDLEIYDNTLRAVAKRKISRGHLDFRISWMRTAGPAPLRLNLALLDAYLEAFRQARERSGLSAEPDLNAALRIPGVLADVEAEPDPALADALTQEAEQALDRLNAVRETEGEALAALIGQANSRVVAHAAELASLRRRATAFFQQRLRERLAALLEGAAIEPQRLVQEAAILADRSDIDEEIQRLQIHAAQLADLLRQGGEVGKRLDFLLQEMGRETNTILAKSGAAGDLGLQITSLALAVKAEVERMREQALNLE